MHGAELYALNCFSTNGLLCNKIMIKLNIFFAVYQQPLNISHLNS